MLHFGAAYYPEQWPESRWPTDAELMRQAHFNVVRLGEFAWAMLETEEGRFDFAWLDRAIDLLHRHGLSVVLGTPTAAPPAWLVARHPDVLPVDQDGRRWTFGHRRHYCVSSADYRRHTSRIVEALARRYADHPAVIGWQIDNELGTYCYCQTCQAAFQDWLRQRHGSLEALNQAWGTRFWSQVYTAWEQIPLPWSAGLVPNPGLALDYRRFMSDAFVDYQRLQLEILRALAPRHWVTHNFMGFDYDRLDYHRLIGGLDFAAWDNYPLLHDSSPSQVALSHSAIRGLHPQPFWVMEAQAGASGWERLSRNPRPGEIRLWSHQALAHGAAGLVYFRWRTATSGTEQLWHGVLDHGGRPGRRLTEVATTGAEFARLAPHLEGPAPAAPAALMLDYQDRFAWGVQPQTAGLTYDGVFQRLYASLHSQNLPCDVIGPEAPLEGLSLLVLPMKQMVGPELAGRLEAFVRRGGHLLVTFRSGFRDREGRMGQEAPPGPLAALCGVEVEEYEALRPGERRALSMDGGPAEIEGWAEALQPGSAEVLARHRDGPWAGRPAVTLRRHGRGLATYVGGHLDEGAWRSLLGRATRQAGLRPPLEAPGLEVRQRAGQGTPVLFLLNHADEPRAVELPGRLEDLLAGGTRQGGLTLEPQGVAVLGG